MKVCTCSNFFAIGIVWISTNHGMYGWVVDNADLKGGKTNIIQKNRINQGIPKL